MAIEFSHSLYFQSHWFDETARNLVIYQNRLASYYPFSFYVLFFLHFKFPVLGVDSPTSVRYTPDDLGQKLQNLPYLTLEWLAVRELCFYSCWGCKSVDYCLQVSFFEYSSML